MAFDNMDPLGAWSDTFGLFTNLLLRTLVGYDHVAGAAGARLVPDLAARVPAPTDGGRTYTFTLRPGVMFGPPVNRPVASSDVRYALERLARPRNETIYATYFRVIRGFDAYRLGHAKHIAGIETPNGRTVVMHLTRPTGDFLHRLTLPAAAPVPHEVAGCFEGRPRAYGSDLVSSGPYMIDGAGAVDARSCRRLRPMRGISDTRLLLVRNPRYDPATDSRAARESNPDRFVFLAEHFRQAETPIELIRQVNAGELDDVILYTTPKVIGAAARRAEAEGRLRVSPAYWRFSMTMNLTRPPFDDVHVRRALSWALDRTALRKAAAGGRMAGEIPQHLVPSELLGGRLNDFTPFATPGGHGSVVKARAEMAKSKYANGRGICRAKVCKGVFLSKIVQCTCYSVGTRVTPIIHADAAKIGITFADHSRSPDKLTTPAANLAFFPNVEWMSDYPDPAAFLEPTFQGSTITAEWNRNPSLVGITVPQAHALGVTGRIGNVPSVDADLARCAARTGDARLACYAELDRKLSTEIVPSIPFLDRNRISVIGRQVAQWAFDQSTATTSFAHVALAR